MFVRVRDKITRHQYDVWEPSLDPSRHERLDSKRYPPSPVARPAKPHKPTAPSRARSGPSRTGGRPSASTTDKE